MFGTRRYGLGGTVQSRRVELTKVAADTMIFDEDPENVKLQ